MKQKILDLRAKNLTYRQIAAQLGCSIGTVCYHCGKGQKVKKARRQQIWRRQIHPFLRKLENFQSLTVPPKTSPSSDAREALLNKLKSFRRKQSHGDRTSMHTNITLDAVIQKYEEHPYCYLTGRAIDLEQPHTYQFDHIVPRSSGGDNSLDNLGICCKAANMAKHNLSVAEFVALCKEVVAHH